MNHTSESWTAKDQQESEPDFYGKWINVDSRLPVEGTWVIGSTYLFTPVTKEKKPISKELFFDGENEHGVHWLCDGDWPNKVTHWMPLPPAKAC